jgi:hypothetical protein
MTSTETTTSAGCPPLFDLTALSWSLYWASAELRRDFEIISRPSGIQRLTQAAGRDDPPGWFYEAARSYAPSDALGVIARRACVLVAMRFEEGRPQ